MEKYDAVENVWYDDGWKPVAEAPVVHGYRCFVEGKDGYRQHGFYVVEGSAMWIDERGYIIDPVRFKSADEKESSNWYLSNRRMPNCTLNEL